MSPLFPLTLRNVCVRRRGKSVLGPINLTVENGPPLVVIGPNGSGKTTLLRVMHGIERISEGSLEWAAHSPAKHSYVFQHPTVLRRSVVQNLAYPLQLMRVPKDTVSQACSAWLTKINMTGFGDTPATKLSGGERQKLAIARALIRQPDLLFLDEPTANLDGHTTREIEVLLGQASATGTRVVMATHDMGQARRLAAHVIFMKGGKIREQGTSEALTNPQTADLAAFLKGDIVT